MIEDFFKDSRNWPLVRYVGFSMAMVGMLVGVVAAIVATCTGFTGLGFFAVGLFMLSFSLLPVTDINFPKARGW